MPLAESVGSLRIRAAAGAAYAKWAAATRDPQDAALAGKTYRRMLVDYTMQTDTLDALKAIADLGLAELYLHSGQYAEAHAAMQDTPAVPQDFWQEMRQTESAIAVKETVGCKRRARAPALWSRSPASQPGRWMAHGSKGELAPGGWFG